MSHRDAATRCPGRWGRARRRRWAYDGHRSTAPPIKGFEWSAGKTTFGSPDHCGVAQGVAWTLPASMLKELGRRLTASLAVRVHPDRPQAAESVGTEHLPPEASLGLANHSTCRIGGAARRERTIPKRSLAAGPCEFLPEAGVAVLRYDRRPGDDVPFELQAQDAEAAIAALRAAVDRPDLPIVYLGYSQGAWSAFIVAARRVDLAGLVAVGASGVSPALQMRGMRPSVTFARLASVTATSSSSNDCVPQGRRSSVARRLERRCRRSSIATQNGRGSRLP